MGLFFIPSALFVIIGASNVVNLTDGLDGLATVPNHACCFIFHINFLRSWKYDIF